MHNYINDKEMIKNLVNYLENMLNNKHNWNDNGNLVVNRKDLADTFYGLYDMFFLSIEKLEKFRKGLRD